MKSIKLRVAELFIGKVDDSTKRGFWLVSELVQKHKLFLLLLLVVGVFVGLVEGASIGLLAFSVVVITGETTTCLDSIATFSQYFPVDLCDNYNKYDMFVAVVVSSIFIQIIKSIIVYTSSYLGVVLNTRIAYEMQTRVFDHMMKLSYQDVNHYSVGERQHIFGSAHVFSKLALAVNELITIFFVLGAYFVILMAMSWKLTIVSFVLLVCLVLFVLPFLGRIRSIGKEQRDTGVLIGRRVIDYFFAVRLIKIYEKSEEVIDIVKHIIARRVGLARSMSLFQNAVPNIQETILVVSVSLVLLGGFYFAGDEAEQVLPQILAYILVLYRCNSRVVSLNSIRTSFNVAIAPLEHISDFLNFGNASVKKENKDLQEVDSHWKELFVEGLSFKYNSEDKKVLDNVNLSVKRGQKIAFVGQSGSGKSTLVDLIIGLLKPTQGQLKFDEVNLSFAQQRSWISQFSMVSQNDLILDGTVMENLLFADTSASREQIIAACKIADAHDFIETLENGYDSVLGERGYKVSGGQIQRIAFARALLKDSPVLILDEATSALDNIVERKIINQLINNDNDKTIIMIAHRLSTVMDADVIYVFDQGSVVDSGTHKELLTRAGLYQSLWKSTEETK
ncbi:MAG: ABC transporter ATP-binding protein [Arenicella sp.]